MGQTGRANGPSAAAGRTGAVCEASLRGRTQNQALRTQWGDSRLNGRVAPTGRFATMGRLVPNSSSFFSRILLIGALRLLGASCHPMESVRHWGGGGKKGFFCPLTNLDILDFFLKYFCSFELARQFSMSTDFFINFDFKND